MRVVYTQDGGVAHDITRLVTSATWAGDYKQAARTLDIQVLAGNRAGAGGIITGRIGLGEMLQLFKGSAELFRGYVFSVEKGLSSSARTIHAYDGLVYALKSKIAQNFTAMTAKDITRQVAAGLGFPVEARRRTPGWRCLSRISEARLRGHHGRMDQGRCGHGLSISCGWTRAS